jgi:hypothetical protein
VFQSEFRRVRASPVPIWLLPGLLLLCADVGLPELHARAFEDFAEAGQGLLEDLADVGVGDEK